MQQLLGDKAWDTDNAFLREFFLQRLLPNVRMVLLLHQTRGALIIWPSLQIRSPAIAAVSTFELEHLRKEVAEVKSMLQAYKFS